ALVHVLFFFYWHHGLLDLHSFPTRRSSDLCLSHSVVEHPSEEELHHAIAFALLWFDRYFWSKLIPSQQTRQELVRDLHRELLERSEEHTSELQSRFDLVCRLLLEKKNIINR